MIHDVQAIAAQALRSIFALNRRLGGEMDKTPHSRPDFA
jgi:hypothetical protein